MTLSTTTTPHFLAHLPPYVRSALLDVVHPPLRYSAGAKKNTNTSVTPADTIKHLLKISHPSLDFRHNPNLGSDLCPVWESLRSISQKRLDHFETTCDDAITASKATLSVEEQMTGFTMTYILSPISAMLADPTTILRAERIRRRIYQETGTRSGGGGNADAALMEPKDLDAEDPARDGEWGDDGEEYQDFVSA